MRRKSRRTLVIASIIVPVIGGTWLFTTGPGQRLLSEGREQIEQWVGRQIQTIANHFLNPDFTFDRLRYEYPGTAHLSNVTLTDGDERIVFAERLTIRFSERPRIGRPIVIESIHLTNPTVRLIQDERNRLIGFSDFLATTTGRELEDGGSTKPSDIFAIQTMRIDNGTLEYTLPRTGQTMRLDELSFDLKNDPDKADPGWYELAAAFERSPFFQLDVAARYNIDTRLIDISQAALAMDLLPEHYDHLPPQLQQFLTQYEVTGSMSAFLSGTVPLGSAAEQSNLALNVNLTDGYVAGEDYELPLSSLTIEATMSEGVISLAPLRAEALRGELTLDGTLETTGQRRADIALDIIDVRIEDILREITGHTPRYAGRVSIQSRIRSHMNSWREHLSGSGTIDVRDGRLINLPIIAGLVNRAGGAGAGGDDRLNARLSLNGERLRLSEIDLVSAAVAARGEGEFYLDRRIDFRINAGPLERLQQKLGRIGGLLGEVTDKLVTYHITGTLDEPAFRVRPLNLGDATEAGGAANSREIAHHGEVRFTLCR